MTPNNAANNEALQPKFDIAMHAMSTPIGNLLGYATVTLNDMITVHDVRIMNGTNGIFVAMPSKPDKTSQTGYRRIVHLDDSIKESFERAVINAYYDALEDTNKESSTGKTSSPKPRLADKVVAARETADARNATVLDKKSVRQVVRER